MWHYYKDDHGTRKIVTKLCNFPISETKRCKQPIADDKPNCGRHKINLPANQLGQNPIVYEKDDELHIWRGEPDGVYCLIHNDPAYQVLYQVAGEVPPCCLQDDITWKDEHGELHRDDGPARIWPDGTQRWYQHGELHRDDGPAVIMPNGAWAWFQHDKLHRDDGPTVLETDGTQKWYQCGKRHRDDGPAVIETDGTREWYQHGERHRDDGPAVIEAHGTQKWWWRGKQVPEEEHAKLREQSGGV